MTLYGIIRLWKNKYRLKERGKQKRTEEVSVQNAVLAVLSFQEKTPYFDDSHIT